MSLNRRQITCYKHTIDIWSVTTGVDPTTDKPGVEAVAIRVPGVPCVFDFTPNVDVETAAGRVKEFTLLTTDKCCMEANVPIQDTDIIVNVTILASGAKSNAWGQCSNVLGAPNVHDTLGRRKANSLFVEIMTTEKPPDVIKTYYGLS